VLRIRGAGVVLEAAFNEAVIGGHDHQGTPCDAVGAQSVKERGQFLVVDLQAGGLLSVVLSELVAHLVRLPVVHPQQEPAP
jgi:hypothetical protein